MRQNCENKSQKYGSTTVKLLCNITTVNLVAVFSGTFIAMFLLPVLLPMTC
jgi:hypothetical protein